MIQPREGVLVGDESSSRVDENFMKTRRKSEWPVANEFSETKGGLGGRCLGGG